MRQVETPTHALQLYMTASIHLHRVTRTAEIEIITKARCMPVCVNEPGQGAGGCSFDKRL